MTDKENQNIHETATTVSMDETQKSFCEPSNDSTDFSHIYDGREKGWIRLYRSLLDHPLWLSEEFTKAQAFVDLVLLANHAKKKVIIKGKCLTIERSQVARSTVSLSKRWKWDRQKVSTFLRFLEKQQMISYQTNNLTTIITICNYNKYQGLTDNEPAPVHTAKQQRIDSKPNTNNKNKKNNNNKNSAGTLHGQHEAEGSFLKRHTDTSWRLDA